MRETLNTLHRIGILCFESHFEQLAFELNEKYVENLILFFLSLKSFRIETYFSKWYCEDFIETQYVNRFQTKRKTFRKYWLYTKQSIMNWNEHVIKMVKLDKLHHIHSSGFDVFHSSNLMLSLYIYVVWMMPVCGSWRKMQEKIRILIQQK